MKYQIRGFVGVKSNDGHDAPILIVADILKKGGVEVILGGYDLTVEKFVAGIIQEGVNFAGISSYNGSHVPFFLAVRNELEKRNYPHIHLIGGGGATITPQDMSIMEENGVDKIFRSGESHTIVPYIQGHYDFSTVPENPEEFLEKMREGDKLAIAQLINLAEEKARLESLIENNGLASIKNNLREGKPGELGVGLFEHGRKEKELLEQCLYYQNCLSRLSHLESPTSSSSVVFGIAGRGGAGKSTLTDELVLRYFNDKRTEGRKLALVSIDPSSHNTGGALLADRIAYMYSTDKNWVDIDRIFIRSVASRGYGHGIARALPDILQILKTSGYDIFVETYGLGQPDTGIVGLVERCVYVTTPDLGGASQIGKEEMLNIPGVYVVLNKNELRGAGYVSSLLRNTIDKDRLFFTTAIEHKNSGVDKLYQALTQHFN